MAKQPHANKCGAKTRSGEPCKNYAMDNGRCRMHGGKSTGAPKGNNNAEKHGIWRKHLPEETLELVEQFQQEDKIQKLKRNIAIQEAAIIRSQKIMHVEDKEEVINHLKKIQESPKQKLEEYEYEYPWQRQGNYLNALSRAMDTLTKMYKTLYEITEEGDHVKEAVNGFIKALEGTAEEVWGDNNEESQSKTI